MRSSRAVLVALALLGAAAPGCTDVRGYTGTWTGDIVSSAHLRRGFDPTTRLTLTITHLDKTSLEGRLTIPPSTGGTAAFTDVARVPLETTRNDVLGDLRYDGDPLATTFHFIEPDDPADDHALVLVSAYAGDRVEVRVLRHDLYGVFRLSR
jgi:hypothetical protein